MYSKGIKYFYKCGNNLKVDDRVKKILNSSNTASIICMAIMVFFLVNYNMVWNKGLSDYSIAKVLQVYPFVFLLSFIVKKLISLPLTNKIHEHPKLKDNKKISIAVPLTIVIINSLVCLAISTYVTHNYHEGLFFKYYLFYWIRSIVIAIPLLFFLVKPRVKILLLSLRMKIS